MKSLLKLSIVLFVLTLIPSMAAAQKDSFGVLDTVYADVAKVNDHSWAVTISYYNDEKVVGLSVPIKFDAGDVPVVADSAVYTGGRAENFTFKGFRPDTTEQTVTMGMIANLGPTDNTLIPGKGRLVTVFVSSLDKQPVPLLNVDTTTTHPANSLMMIADRFQGGEYPDTLSLYNRRILEIRPAWVVRRSD